MAYAKDLGRVKGKKGNYFIPDIKIVDNELVFDWTETPVEDEESPIDESFSKSIKTPIFIPDYNPRTGELTFTPTVPVKDGNILYDPTEDGYNDHGRFTFNIKGPKGDTGETKLNVEFITNKTFDQVQSEIDFQWNEIEGKLGVINNPTRDDAQDIISQYLTYKTDTLYIFTSTNDQNEIHPIYIYYESDLVEDEIIPEIRELKKLQDVSLDLDSYYTKSETYSQTEIDNLIDIQNTYLEKILLLLDTSDDTYNIGGQEISSQLLDELIDNKMAGYVKLEDVQYVDIEGTLYFVSYTPSTSTEEPNQGE